MKTINNFFLKTHILKVWLIFYFILTLFISVSLFFLDYIDPSINLLVKDMNYFKIGASISMIYTTIITLIINNNKQSYLFWDSVKEIETLIDNAKNKDDLNNIYNNQLKKLASDYYPGEQENEVKRLKTIIESRYEKFNKKTKI